MDYTQIEVWIIKYFVVVVVNGDKSWIGAAYTYWLDPGSVC